MKKKFLVAMLSAMSLVASLTMPNVVVGAATANNNTSVDEYSNGKSTATGSVTINVGAKKAELTIGLDGSYNLKLALSKDAANVGLQVVNNNTVRAFVGYNEDGAALYKDLNVTWNSNLPSYASVNKSGKITANKVCQLNNETGKYKRVVVTAEIPAYSYVMDNVTYNIESSVVYKNLITVVPERDLLVYYLGVWSEDMGDQDAQHNHNYDVDSYNVKNRLNQMATHYHFSDTTNFKIKALTKTNNGIVRAYIETQHPQAGIHYYVVKFSTKNNGVNELSITGRSYHDSKYEVIGQFTRTTTNNVNNNLAH